MRSVPIPGDILRSNHILGLTFDEIVTLGAVPLVVVFPTLFIDQIPLVATLGIIVVSVIGVLAIIIRTPDGQTPLEWAPAALKRRFTPDVYYLKPRIRDRDPAVYMDVVHTAGEVTDGGTPDAADLATDSASQETVAVDPTTPTDFRDTAFEAANASRPNQAHLDGVSGRGDPDANAAHSQTDD